MFHLAGLTDYGLLFLRIMVGAIFIDSGYEDLRNPDARSQNLGLPKSFTIVLAAAEVAGGLGVIFGVLAQLASIGLMLIMLGAVQKKIFVWKTGFWGAQSPGWYYELTLISMLVVVLFTNGGRLVMLL